MVLWWWRQTLPQEEGDAANTEGAAAAEGEGVKEGAEKEAAKEEMPEPKKVSAVSVTSHVCQQETKMNQMFLIVLQQRRKRKRSGDSDDEGSGSESDSDSDSDSNSNCSDKPVKKEEVEDKDEDEEEGEGEESGITLTVPHLIFILRDWLILPVLPAYLTHWFVYFFSYQGEEEKQKESVEEEKKEEKKAKDDSPRPRPLHRTCSLFMRSIAPTISKAEIIAVSRSQEAV